MTEDEFANSMIFLAQMCAVFAILVIWIWEDPKKGSRP